MPRTTRAAARALEPDTTPQPIFEDDNTATAPEVSSQPTLAPARPIFGELSGNNIPTPEPQEQTVTIYAMPAQKVRGKKGRPATKKNKFDLQVQTENDIHMAAEVLEDENQSDSSDAAEAAAEQLRGDERPAETLQVPVDVERPSSPPSAAAKEATSTLLYTPHKVTVVVQGNPPQTPKFDPAMHKEELGTGLDNKEDSFVEDITTRLPAKDTPQVQKHEEDSFVEAIISRSPSKATPRIEDSVAEMDALDDAIEKVAEILPMLEERDLESPIANRKVVKEAAIPSLKRKTALTTTSATTPATKGAKGHLSITKATTRPSFPRPSTLRVKPTARASVIPNQQRAVSTDNSSSSLDRRSKSFSASPTKAQPNTTQKIRKLSTRTSLSTSKAGFVPSKSTKATTTSTFVLPGEAIAAKLKVQREERQKREEEAAAREVGKTVAAKPTTAPTARPRLSTSVAPVIKTRETKTSLARQSLMAADREKRSLSGTSNKENTVPTKATAQPATRSPPVKAKELAVKRKPGSMRAGIATDAKKSGTPTRQPNIDGTGSVQANSAVRRIGTGVATETKCNDSLAPSPSSGCDARAEPNVSKADLVSQKGKEVFGRNKLQKADADRARREKEDAAKKARAEAAERGRIASREWAEKQKKKLAAVEAAKKQQEMPAVNGEGVAVQVAAGA